MLDNLALRTKAHKKVSRAAYQPFLKWKCLETITAMHQHNKKEKQAQQMLNFAKTTFNVLSFPFTFQKAVI